jgi:hypothetical protein
MNLIRRIAPRRTNTGRRQIVAVGLAGDLTLGGAGGGSESKRFVYAAR